MNAETVVSRSPAEFAASVIDPAPNGLRDVPACVVCTQPLADDSSETLSARVHLLLDTVTGAVVGPAHPACVLDTYRARVLAMRKKICATCGYRYIHHGFSTEEPEVRCPGGVGTFVLLTPPVVAAEPGASESMRQSA